MKKNLAAALAAMMLMAAMLVPTSAAGEGVSVTVDGVPVVWTDAVPYVDENDRTMVPLRATGEAMGLEVDWLVIEEWESAGMAVFTQRNADPNWDWAITFSPGSYYYGKYGAEDAEQKAKSIVDWYPQMLSGDPDEGKMDTCAVVKDGRTYAPIRYLAEALNYTVEWDQATETVNIVSPVIGNFGYYFNIKSESDTHWVALHNLQNIESIKIESIEIWTADETFQTVEITPLSEKDTKSINEANGISAVTGVTFTGDINFDSMVPVRVNISYVKSNGVAENTTLVLR